MPVLRFLTILDDMEEHDLRGVFSVVPSDASECWVPVEAVQP